MTKQTPQPLKIIIMTGSTGRTGAQVVKAALAQFEQPQATIEVVANVRTVTMVRKTVRQAKREGAIIVQTLIAPRIREAAAREIEAFAVPSVDLLGPLVRLLADQLAAEPRNEPGLSHELNKEQFDRMDAVDFTMAHDDGQRVDSLHEADVVVVGASRVSKSVTCFFLAYRGIRAANVPLSIDFDTPPALLEVPAKKVVALTMNARRLEVVRHARGEAWAKAMDYYADRQRISRELGHVETLATKHGWWSIDVSYKAVEDVAEEIVHLLKYGKRLGEGSRSTEWPE